MYKKHGLIGTFIFHAGLLALLIFLGYTTPLPLPEEEGILVNFGDAPVGRGSVEPRQAERQPNPVTSSAAAPAEIKTPVETQDFEEAPALPSVKKPANKKQDQQKDTENQPAEEQPQEKKPERVLDRRSLYGGRSNTTDNSASEGETSGNANQGNPFGSPASTNRSQGNSTGTKGVSFSLSGRNPLSLPKPDYNYQVEGIVVVEVTVDREGKVTRAVPGVRGSTTLNENLLDAARKAALRARFDSKSDAAAYQKGTITYHFMLQ